MCAASGVAGVDAQFVTLHSITGQINAQGRCVVAGLAIVGRVARVAAGQQLQAFGGLCAGVHRKRDGAADLFIARCIGLQHAQVVMADRQSAQVDAVGAAGGIGHDGARDVGGAGRGVQREAGFSEVALAVVVAVTENTDACIGLANAADRQTITCFGNSVGYAA